LDLFENRISEIEAGALNGLDKLNSLNLGFNYLTKLVTGVFEGLNNLASLSLEHNSLLYLEEDIFGSNTQFPTDFDLSLNNLLFLPNSFSSATTSVPSSIDVRYNCLDCTLYPYLGYYSNCLGYQSDTYCPRSTNKCPTFMKYKLDNCFKCNTSSDNALCDICMPGYKHIENGCGCMKCEEGDPCVFGEPRDHESPCATCALGSAGGKSLCLSCVMGNIFVAGNCVPCGEHECCPGGTETAPRYTNCSKCYYDMLTCEECMEGYVLKDGACKSKTSGALMNHVHMGIVGIVVFILSIIGMF